MKRSEINKALRELEAMCRQEHCYLPPFCHFTPEEWKTKGHEYDEVRDCMLGWDITDYGLGDFDKVGFSLITIRNGSRKQPEKYPKVYAEKLLFLKEGQYSPNHFHWFKTEDIINRGGGILCMRLWKADKETEMLTEEPLVVSIDGVSTRVAPGETVRLAPGQSICYEPYLYHTFWAEDDHCLVGEVSTVNDDMRDNRFLTPKGRFPQIEEDVPAEHLLCNEYPEV